MSPLETRVSGLRFGFKGLRSVFTGLLGLGFKGRPALAAFASSER